MRESLKRVVPKAIGFYINALALVAPRLSAKKSFAVFSKPRRGRVAAHHQDFLDPARHELLKFKKGQLQTYHWPGKGNRIVLVHGWESHTHRYKALVERLREQDYDIYAFDAPGHGYSDGGNLYVPLYNEALELVKEKYRPVFMVGHSIGAMTVLYNQYGNPSDFVKKLVVLGAPDRLDTILSDYQKIISMSDRAMRALDDLFYTDFDFRTVDFASSAFAKAISIPALIIHDPSDTITPSSGSEAIHAAHKNSTLILTEGLNHSLYSEDVNTAIIAFLAEEIKPNP